ncbi:MAG: phosphoribosylaminoimidazolesuccinocarboxamide synthase, partial [Candidatus Saccharimonadales bacterium]
LYHGKVRDVYTIGDRLLMVATDRISAFDVVLPKGVPYKGQVLNQLAAHFLEATSDIVPNWLQAVPDPTASIGVKADPVKVEMVIRGVLVGHAWREYQAGKRLLCGVTMPDGMKEYDSFPEPIITPTTKEDIGHDEDITEEDIIKHGLATAEEWRQLADYTRRLFARGQEMARARGLVLADTKYEFGRADGKIILIDEVHTPDSSRYFYADSYDAFVGGKSDETPRQLSKEFVREWLMERGFNGTEGQAVPDLPDEFMQQISERYIELYEKISGDKFVKPEAGDPLARIEANVKAYLAKAAG